MMLYKNTKVKVSSPDGDTYYFDNVAAVLQDDTLAPYVFIIRQDYVLRKSIDLMKENGFQAGKGKKQKISRTNYYGRWLRWWHSPSSKYTRASRTPAT